MPHRIVGDLPPDVIGRRRLASGQHGAGRAVDKGGTIQCREVDVMRRGIKREPDSAAADRDRGEDSLSPRVDDGEPVVRRHEEAIQRRVKRAHDLHPRQLESWWRIPRWRTRRVDDPHVLRAIPVVVIANSDVDLPVAWVDRDAKRLDADGVGRRDRRGARACGQRRSENEREGDSDAEMAHLL